MDSGSFQSKYFKLTAKEAASKAAITPYDFVIVGAGFGGGTLAADLFNRDSSKTKKILVVEAGNLVFHSHCFNAPGPTVEGISDQQSVKFFQEFKANYVTKDSPDWEGGPLYALGGRSDVWSLFIPRPHDDTLAKYFPSKVVTDLNDKYFEMAESTLNISIPTNPNLVHWNLIYELNKTYGTPPTADAWQCGRTASQFKQDKDFTFAAGAYSTVNRLLKIAMDDPEGKGNFQILLGSTVDHLTFKDDGKSIESVVVGITKIKTKHVVLCAGSVNSAAILLRSDVKIGGGHLTDHDVYVVEKTFKYPQDPEEVSMRLQAYTNLSTPEHVALARIAINPSTLPPTIPPTGYFQMAFILSSPLLSGNTITFDEKKLTVQIKRASPRPDYKKAMVSMTNHAMAAVKETLKVTFDEGPPVLKLLKLGYWAHELGSLPMPGGKDSQIKPVLDEDLTLCDDDKHTGVSVCDNSVFPFSPSVNPSLTLAALALRLSAFLLP